MFNFHFLDNNPFTNKMNVQLNVFGPNIEDRILQNENLSEIILQECRRKKMHGQFIEKQLNP